jgi:hypothetical protein
MAWQPVPETKNLADSREVMMILMAHQLSDGVILSAGDGKDLLIPADSGWGC